MVSPSLFYVYVTPRTKPTALYSPSAGPKGVEHLTPANPKFVLPPETNTRGPGIQDPTFSPLSVAGRLTKHMQHHSQLYSFQT